MSRLPGKLPGLYMIQTDEKGERRFFHWRDSAAARSLMDLPETADILESLAGYDVVYLSAITLSLYGARGAGAAVRGAQARARRWGRALPSTPISAPAAGPTWTSRAAVFQDAFDLADIVLASTEDLLPLYPGESQRSPAGAHSRARRWC